MVRSVGFLLGVSLLYMCSCCGLSFAEESATVPVLVYHRFGPTVADSMTVTTPVFESQVKWLKDNGYTVIPLRSLVNYLRGDGPPPPPKSVVITADDGHKTVYSDMQAIVRKYEIPVTLFIYPSAISNASYAMTWDELKELQRTGLFDIQSHTYWHPNFKQEKRKLTPEDYGKLVDSQLRKSKTVLETKLGSPVDLLAWPFGIYDEGLEKDAEKAGYKAAFSIDRRHANTSESIMAIPRYLMENHDGTRGFEAIISGRSAMKVPSPHLTQSQ